MAPVQSTAPARALLLRIGGVLALSTTMLFVKLCDREDVHLTEIMFWRQAFTVPIIGGWIWLTRSGQILRTDRFGAHFRRAFMGMVAMTFAFGSVQLLPLAEAQTLNFTCPIFATLLAMVLLKEKIGRWRWAALFIGFLGILVITQPGQSRIPVLGVAVGLTASFLIALLSIMIKDLNRTERPLAIVFWFGALSTPMMAVFLPVFMTAHDWHGWALLLAVGVTGGIGQILLTLSLRYGAVSSVIVMDYTGLVWATLYGWWLFGTLPPATTWLGAPLIITAGLLIAWREHRSMRERLATPPGTLV